MHLNLPIMNCAILRIASRVYSYLVRSIFHFLVHAVYSQSWQGLSFVQSFIRACFMCVYVVSSKFKVHCLHTYQLIDMNAVMIIIHVMLSSRPLSDIVIMLYVLINYCNEY